MTGTMRHCISLVFLAHFSQGLQLLLARQPVALALRSRTTYRGRGCPEMVCEGMASVPCSLGVQGSPDVPSPALPAPSRLLVPRTLLRAGLVAPRAQLQDAEDGGGYQPRGGEYTR